MKTKYVPRVNQLDALELDNEIQFIFKDQLLKALQNIFPKHISKFQPEIELFLNSIIWKYSVLQSGSTFGQQLLSITYDIEQLYKKKLILHYIINVGSKYLKDNATLRLTSYIFIQSFLSYLENTLSFLFIVNFFRFLKSGKWPSIGDYVLGLENITLYGNKRRNVGYIHMTRELIWGGFMELLGFTVPLINYKILSRKIQNFWSPTKNNILTQEKICMQISTKCSYCNERPVLPYDMGCSHVFCYYCLKGNILADNKFQCPECGLQNQYFKPVSCT